jgi:hypothetical protein
MGLTSPLPAPTTPQSASLRFPIILSTVPLTILSPRTEHWLSELEGKGGAEDVHTASVPDTHQGQGGEWTADSVDRVVEVNMVGGAQQGRGWVI